ncbi:MAG: twin-arginine translocation signal domain-containing protein, partial [bacterium]|nr:twin-arginine translocation signal domain-containing protein [bacterium]
MDQSKLPNASSRRTFMKYSAAAAGLASVAGNVP